MSKILITGATGGLGSAVVEFLTKTVSPQDIAVLVRDPKSEKALAFAQQGLDVRVGDYIDADLLQQAFTGIQTLYFISASDINGRLQQHKNVVQASIAAQVGHIIYTSAGRKNESSEAPLFPVMEAHIETEKLIKASGLSYTILRHNLYAEVAPMFIGAPEQVKASKVVYFPTGVGQTAFATRTDLAEAGAKIITNLAPHTNQTYSLNGSESITFAEIAAYISEAQGQEIVHISPEIPEFEATLKSFGLPPEIVGMSVMFSLGISDGEFQADATDLENILGRKPQTMSSFIKHVYTV